MKRISNYVLGQWTPHEGSGIPQYDAVSGALISTCGSEGLDYADMMHYARSVGGPALRKMTFPERGRMLKALALYLSSRKEAYYLLSYQTGATRSDSWIDIDGGIGTLFAYASLRRKFTDAPYHVEGDPARLSKEGTFVGQHILSPKHGVAVHINAFNFPVWGMLEKLSVNLLAGVPAIVKPSEITSFLSEQVVRDIIGSGLLPAGALQLVCGSGIGILDPLTSQDVVTFTGSAETGRKLRAHPSVIAHSVPFNMEADSLNAIVMGDDVKAGSPEFDLFIKEVRREVTAKCGQKCTAIRRMIVPEALLEDVQIALGRELAKTTLGNPQTEGVRMGALVNKAQQAKVQKHIAELLQESELVYGSLDHFEVIGADKAHGAFMPPLILRNNDPLHHQKSHTVEAFGPVVTLMPYQSPEEAAILANMGKGSLVSTVCTADTRFARTYIMES
ncbi:MAG: 3,4-dehydroadipyl-CoA semialdehyde dehydrogenase, partial [Bacteroidetes bacterium]